MTLVSVLEQPLAQARTQLGTTIAGDESTLRDVVLTGLTWPSSYWFELAVSWLEQGFPIDAEIAAVVRALREEAGLSQTHRHRAFRVIRRWERSRESELSVVFGNPRHGWIDFSISAGQQSFASAISHVYLALGELCRGLALIATGIADVDVVFQLEPQELVLTFRRDEGEAALETKLELRERLPQRAATQVFLHRGDAAKTLLVFWRALRRLQTGLPRERFAEEWRGDFPEAEMNSLTLAIQRLSQKRPKPA